MRPSKGVLVPKDWRSKPDGNFLFDLLGIAGLAVGTVAAVMLARFLYGYIGNYLWVGLFVLLAWYWWVAYSDAEDNRRFNKAFRRRYGFGEYRETEAYLPRIGEEGPSASQKRSDRIVLAVIIIVAVSAVGKLIFDTYV